MLWKSNSCVSIFARLRGWSDPKNMYVRSASGQGIIGYTYAYASAEVRLCAATARRTGIWQSITMRADIPSWYRRSPEKDGCGAINTRSLSNIKLNVIACRYPGTGKSQDNIWLFSGNRGCLPAQEAWEDIRELKSACSLIQEIIRRIFFLEQV